MALESRLMTLDELGQHLRDSTSKKTNSNVLSTPPNIFTNVSVPFDQ
jgi:hypothetical protein